MAAQKVGHSESVVSTAGPALARERLEDISGGESGLGQGEI